MIAKKTHFNVHLLIKTVTEAVVNPPHTHTHKAADESAKLLASMKATLYGTGDQEPQSELAAQLAQEFYNHDMLLHLVTNLHKLDFEVSGMSCDH